MKNILIVSAIVAMSSGYAFAGGNLNTALTGQLGFGNQSLVLQGGAHNVNTALTGQVGAFNASGVAQGGYHNKNTAVTVQFGVGNTSLVGQD